MGDYPPPVFLDATVLSNFASTDSIPELVEAVNSPCVTEAVREEIKQGVAFGHEYLENAVSAFEHDVPVKSLQTDVESHQFRNRLDVGETASLIGALKNEGDTRD